MRCAILVDGAFYRRRALKALGEKSPKDRADELIDYCWRHLGWHGQPAAELYRIYYYDCPPITKQVYHPSLQKTVDLSKTGLYKWSTDFYDELKKSRFMAFYMYGGLYGIFSGKDVENVEVNYYSSGGELISTGNSSDIGE